MSSRGWKAKQGALKSKGSAEWGVGSGQHPPAPPPPMLSGTTSFRKRGAWGFLRKAEDEEKPVYPGTWQVVKNSWDTRIHLEKAAVGVVVNVGLLEPVSG